MTFESPRKLLGLATLGLFLALLVLPACDSTPGSRGGAVVFNADTPEAMLASLKAAADSSLNDYYAALREATDCEALPEVCRLLSAREDAATEMMALRSAMVKRFGDAGQVRATAMLRGAFLDQFEEIQRANVFSGTGDAAVLRIGTAVYRLRKQSGQWRIVRFPDPPYDPKTTADAIEILVGRIDAIRVDLLAGRVPTIEELERRIDLAFAQ